MSRLIILRGNSGSGKSTVARALQRRFGRNTLILPQDTVRREMLWARDGYDTAALPLLISLLHYGYENSPITILEGILNANWYRPLFEAALELFGGDIFAYYYDLPFEETLKRHESKAKRLEFGEKEMRRWWNEKDYIGFIPEKTISEKMSLDETVEMIISDVGMISDKPDEVQFRVMTIGDYEKVYDLWMSCKNMGFNNLDDSKEGIEKFLLRNPGMSYVAEEAGRIVGVVLSGHDGRRGYIYHMSVAEDHRKQGIGSRLLENSLAALKREGIHKVALLVFNRNEAGNAFWEKHGFTIREDVAYRNRALTEMIRIDT